MRLGDLEQRILLLCLSRHQSKNDPPMPDVWRAELPGLLFGWQERYRSAYRHRVTYENVPVNDYRAGHATLTRALASLFNKGLIRFSFAWHGWHDPTSHVRGRRGAAKSIRLTPLGAEVAFLRIPWKPRPPSKHLTPIYEVKSVTITSSTLSKNGI
jgi:hypothetical protein